MTKGRGPLIPLIRSTGGVLANNEDRIVGWSLVNPGGDETGDTMMGGTEGTAGVLGEVDWRLRDPLWLGTGGVSSFESNCRPCRRYVSSHVVIGVCGVDTIDWYDLDGERRYEGRRLGAFFSEIGVKYVNPLDAGDLLVRLLRFLGGGVRRKSVEKTPESGVTELAGNRGTSGSRSSGLAMISFTSGL